MSAATARLGYRHQKVQRLRRLLRQRSLRQSQNAFAVEGHKLLDEALSAGMSVESVFVAPGASSSAVDRAKNEGVRVHELEPGVMERVGDTVTPQPVAAIMPFIDVSLSALAGADTIVVLVEVRDPGNAGTVLRSAEASGVGGIVFCEGSVDLYNPKTVRSSAGSIFHVPVVNGGRPSEVLKAVRDLGFALIGTATSGRSYDRFDLTAKTALIFGNEANGLDTQVLACLDETVSIPIAGRSESLNVAMAASVLCFETSRQHRAATEEAASGDRAAK